MAGLAAGNALLNWLLAAWLIPDVVLVYRATPAANLWALLLFGGLWGAGAILFGLGMERLGMAHGYPGHHGADPQSRGAHSPPPARARRLRLAARRLLLLGTAVTLAGVVFCSRAAAAKGRQAHRRRACPRGLGVGLTIAVLAGGLSCFPNVGMNYAVHSRPRPSARGLQAMAGNAAWALLFTAGSVLNFAYCAGLMWDGAISVCSPPKPCAMRCSSR